MSGPFGSSQWMYSSGGFYPTELEQSLRFNDDDSAYLSWTPASAGNRKTWTWSGWVKRGNLGSQQKIMSAASGSLDYTTFEFTSSDTIQLFSYFSSATQAHLQTSAVFRDTSAWYHIVIYFDAANTTARIYVNGVEQSLQTNTQPSNQNYFINSTNEHRIGRAEISGTNYLDGYLAEVNFIDGQALDPTDFGEFKSGVWVANEYTGSYGTNGFYLSFSDSANIGDDLSGNANDWTANNLVATDVVLDSPTQNWATLNPLDADGTLSEGNLEVFTGSSDYGATRSNFAVSNGKYYWEVLCVTSSSNNQVSVWVEDINQPRAIYGGFNSRSWAYYGLNGQIYNNNSGSAYGATFGNGDIIGVALDMDAGEVTFYKNNVSQGVAATGITGDICAGINDGSVSVTTTNVANFGQDSSFAGNKTAQGNTDDNGVGDFYYAPPSGYLALCTANLPDPVIDPAQDDVPSDYFNTVLYSGNSTDPTSVSVGFQPDLLWIKSRSDGYGHILYNAISGAGLFLTSNGTDAEATSPIGLNSFDSNGFTLDDWIATNGSGQSYVAWNWLAGNGTSSNTDGSITSTVSVNQKAGFSVVSWTGNGSSGATVGHGLGAAPKVLIVKNRDQADGWRVFHEGIAPDAETDFLKLNLTDAALDNSSIWNDTAPTNDVYSVGGDRGTNGSGDAMIAYCFAEVEGYSKFGSYTGNGSTDGPFVYTGFEVAWLLVKNASTGSSFWVLVDNARDPYNRGSNGSVNFLFPNVSNAEDTAGSGFDLVSNGFKLKQPGTSINNSGDTFIYMAFAANPFKYANAR